MATPNSSVEFPSMNSRVVVEFKSQNQNIKQKQMQEYEGYGTVQKY